MNSDLTVAPVSKLTAPCSRQSVFQRHVFTCLLICQILVLGLMVRVWAFDASTRIRFTWDIDNAWNHAVDALQSGPSFFSGVVKVYNPTSHIYTDYPPLRFYIVTAWVDLIHHWAGLSARRTDADSWPMLLVNFLFEVAAAAGMYFFCRTKLSQTKSLLAACALWLSPALIVNTFVWPQWDCWVLAPVLWAVWAVLDRRWLLAGICFGCGTMLKGQTLFCLPWLLAFMLLYPIPPGRPAGILGWNSMAKAVSWFIRTSRRLAQFALGSAIIIFIITLPFTIRHNLYWLKIYTHQINMAQPMSVGFWNIPMILARQYGWWRSNLIWSPHWLGLIPFMTINHWLEAATLIWLIILALFSRRAFHSSRVLLAPGTAFAIFVALVPGMHERYGLWAAALLAPAVVISPMAAFSWLILTIMAFLDPFNSCLNGDSRHWVILRSLLGKGAQDMAWFWLFAVFLMTYQIFLSRSGSSRRKLVPRRGSLLTRI